MPFIDRLRSVQNKTDKSITQTDLIFKEMLLRSGQDSTPPSVQYEHLYDILNARNSITDEIASAGLKEDVSLIGSLTEKICEIGIKAVCDETRYSQLPKNWKWLGDFAVTGLPFNLYISVKSYYAKERLIVSGTGQMAAPVVGFGLFKDIAEWNPSRVSQYKHRGFVAIYIPHDIYDALSSKTGKGHPVTNVKNIYDKPFLRDIANFSKDLKKVVKTDNILLKIENL
ncbi:hypothetical protein EDD76_102235 [Kineothrix alysoides]|uniref:Uncharacterized protein n=1 Tax=Kineothrix alysoides TaxID=1469948 RepID=A0A4V2QCJ7_9FIRM|nr:hypothetical protein [Kineothrix alysoides]TCL60537.1 hypothetical protein EDD76_102235 [Kineothrix alysoides]